MSTDEPSGAGVAPGTHRPRPGGLRAGPLNEALLGWFDAHGRELAFRATRDPWAVLVAEVMLQQTQAVRVEPAWRAFLDRFPTAAHLGAAPAGEAIRAWAGLGYYGRAVRLQRAARIIVERHGGRLSGDVAELEALPGVGRYTARAVAALAFGRPVAAVDTNIGRVVRRLSGSDVQAGSADSPAHLQGMADAMVDPSRPGDWTHAMMDVGATICRPRDPLCQQCPLRVHCRSALAGPVATLVPPRFAGRPPVPFTATRRWLRGRMLARLRETGTGRWVRFDGPIGEHPPAAVEEALRGLAADGLVERDERGMARLPS